MTSADDNRRHDFEMALWQTASQDSADRARLTPAQELLAELANAITPAVYAAQERREDGDESEVDAQARRGLERAVRLLDELRAMSGAE
jgi:hypothetical protein